MVSPRSGGYTGADGIINLNVNLNLNGNLNLNVNLNVNLNLNVNVNLNGNVKKAFGGACCGTCYVAR